VRVSSLPLVPIPGSLKTVIAADHQGVLAFGDSITNGGGELQWGVALQSWVQWLARSLGLPFTNYAVDGARVADVVTRQIPAHQQLNAVGEPRYQLGCLYIGVNDVRSPDWDPMSYERDLAAGLTYLHGLCDRVLTVMIPLDLGRPHTGAPVHQANSVIEQQAAHTGSLVLDLRDLRGRERSPNARLRCSAQTVSPRGCGRMHSRRPRTVPRPVPERPSPMPAGGFKRICWSGSLPGCTRAEATRRFGQLAQPAGARARGHPFKRPAPAARSTPRRVHPRPTPQTENVLSLDDRRSRR
jgi:hypothetical protein